MGNNTSCGTGTNNENGVCQAHIPGFMADAFATPACASLSGDQQSNCEQLMKGSVNTCAYNSTSEDKFEKCMTAALVTNLQEISSSNPSANKS